MKKMPKPPKPPVSAEQRKMDAAVFLNAAADFAEQIRRGAVDRAVVDFSEKRRRHEDDNLCQSTVTTCAAYYGCSAVEGGTPLTSETAKAKVDEGLKAWRARRGAA